VEASELHLWVFDMPSLNSKDLRPQPLLKRKDRLQALLSRFDCLAVSVSEVFEDGAKLLAAADRHQLDGVVSKRRGCASTAAPTKHRPRRQLGASQIGEAGCEMRACGRMSVSVRFGHARMVPLSARSPEAIERQSL
jgi:hypothetical protein